MAMAAPVATSPNPRRFCSVCRSPLKPQIHALLASGMSLVQIHAETQKRGRGYKRETLGKHFRICLNGVLPKMDERALAVINTAGKAAATPAEKDFATLVQERALTLLESGDLRVTTQHGLQAQALLDRRLEKQADRDLAINMARLLSGAISMVPSTVIEGRAVEITTLAPPDLVVSRDA